MKIRLAFVPNSSSSSFIVIFPRMPKTVKETFEFLFGHQADPEISVYEYNVSVTRQQAAEIVFKDLQDKSCRCSNKELVYLFSMRYHYSSCGFYQDSRIYWGSDPQLVDQIQQLTIDSKKQDDEYRQKLRLLINKHLKPVPYAWKGSKDDKGKPRYTAKQVKAFESYMAKEKKFRETNEEYKALEKESWDKRHEGWDAVKKLEIALAEKDRKLFLSKTKGKFVAILKYGDRDGDCGAAIEHGTVFDRIEHISISHH